MYQRIVICSGGRLGEWALDVIRAGHYLIGADSGAAFLLEHGFVPDAAIGDFDSVSDPQLQLIRERSVRFIGCDAVDKDYTDTELAFRHALDMNPSEIVMLGALGSRFDHSLANVHLLALALDRGVPAAITDRNNRIRATDGTLTIERSGFTHISLLPLSPTVEGITLQGFRYPLNDATLSIGQSLGISNVLEEAQGTIGIREGRLLIIESRD
jgi:thiamine pyrophosphokinase